MDRRGLNAAYGQACIQCFKAKTKCVSRPDGDGCERCYRFKKPCYPSESTRRSNAQKNQTSVAKIAQLESKVDNLVSLLQSVIQSSGSSDALRKALENESLDASSNTSQQDSAGHLIPTPVSLTGTVVISPPIMDSDNTTVPITATMSPITLSRPPDMDSPNNSFSLPCELSPQEAEEYLSIFRSKMLPYFAFIYFPNNLTAQQLQRDRPFLYKAIIAVVTPSTEQKLERGRELRRILAEVVIVENKSSLDLLLGLLTYITWGNDQFLNKGQSLSRLIQVAISLLRDLRLHKPMPREKQIFVSIMSHPSSTKHPAEVNDHSLDWKRVVLGCFVLHSVISTHFAHVEPPQWTPQMEEYLQAISASKECSNDEVFAAQVRLQLLAQKAFRVREQQEADSTQLLVPTPLPMFLYLKALQVQLQELKASFSSEVQQQGK
ncbi:hypothetical protein B7463_g12065, partial [Scytalidium lignicola]